MFFVDKTTRWFCLTLTYTLHVQQLTKRDEIPNFKRNRSETPMNYLVPTMDEIKVNWYKINKSVQNRCDVSTLGRY